MNQILTVINMYSAYIRHLKMWYTFLPIINPVLRGFVVF